MAVELVIASDKSRRRVEETRDVAAVGNSVQTA